MDIVSIKNEKTLYSASVKTLCTCVEVLSIFLKESSQVASLQTMCTYIKFEHEYNQFGSPESVKTKYLNTT